MQHSEVPALTEIVVADKEAGPYGITTGPDGALWITFVHSGRIARLTLDGELTEYPLDSPECRPTVITPGPDGALWFARSQDHRLGRI
ncbi:virginiamycin B lyase, partial [Streptomyces sp. MCAF7]